MQPLKKYCFMQENSKDVLNCTYCVFISLCYFCFIVILCVQIGRRKRRGSKLSSKKCIIHYMIIGDFVILLFSSLIYDNKYFVEVEPFYRIFVFLFVYYYLGTKISKLSTKRKKSKRQYLTITLAMLVVVLAAMVLVIIELAQIGSTESFQNCQFKYDKISRMVGAILTIILVIFSQKLQNKIDEKIEPDLEYLTQHLKAKTFYQNETQREDLRILIILYCASQFLTMFQMLYYLVKQINYQEPEFDNCIPCQFMPCVQMSAIMNLGLDLLLRFIFIVIIIILPYIALIHFFWLSQSSLEHKSHEEHLKEEVDVCGFFQDGSPKNTQELKMKQRKALTYILNNIMTDYNINTANYIEASDCERLDQAYQKIWVYPSVAFVASIGFFGLTKFLSIPSLLQNPLQSYESKEQFRSQLKKMARPPLIAFATFIGLAAGIAQYEVCRYRLYRKYQPLVHKYLDAQERVFLQQLQIYEKQLTDPN